jgi:predicted Zn finger-like uncharacterized protein
MKIQCNSCSKTFSVPDNAITDSGRLVQCSSCGNKWKQFPVKINQDHINPVIIEKKIKQENISPVIIKKIKKVKKKRKKSVNLYSKEYLEKKHGLKIINPSQLEVVSKENNKNTFGFYSYLITFVVFILTLFGILNYTKEILIFNFPFLESQIYYLYETLDNLKIIIMDIFY